MLTVRSSCCPLQISSLQSSSNGLKMSGDSPRDFKEQVNLLSVTQSLRSLHKSTSDKLSKESNPTDLTFKFQNIKSLSPYNTSLIQAKKCDSSDSDPVFKLSRRNTRRPEKKQARKKNSSSDSDPVFKAKNSSGRKSRKRPANSNSSAGKVSKEACSSSSEDCPVPPVRSPPKIKRTESSSKSPNKKTQAGCSCGKDPEQPRSIIRNILCFLGIERRRNNGSEGTKSCNHHHHKCTCRNRTSRQNPDRKARQCQRESKSAGTENETEKRQTKSSVETVKVANECSDATVEDHSACPCSYCPLRFSEVPSLDDIYLTEEVGNLIAEAIKETVCQQLEEKLSYIEEEIKDNERSYWAEYIAPSMCPRCSSKDLCRLHSPSNQTRKCHRCDSR